jgi:hypothetical protein
VPVRLVFVTVAAAAAFVTQIVMSHVGSTRAGASYSLMGGGCTIKGNISMATGERIYHVPGQKYYSATIVTPSKGERWFCSEAEARAAGWRRSKV